MVKFCTILANAKSPVGKSLGKSQQFVGIIVLYGEHIQPRHIDEQYIQNHKVLREDAETAPRSAT